MPHQMDGSEKISTSRIRSLLAEGCIQQANRLLGRPFFLKGTVENGRKNGRKLGFPTANLYPDPNKFLPARGVYVSLCYIGGQRYWGVTNVGVNPTVEDGEPSQKAETFLFDFNDNIYGLEVMVELHYYLRAERRFDSLDAL